MPLVLLSWVAALVGASTLFSALPALPQETETVQLIDNGGLEEAVPSDALGAYWLVSSGRGRLGIPTSLVSDEAARTRSHALRLTS